MLKVGEIQIRHHRSRSKIKIIYLNINRLKGLMRLQRNLLHLNKQKSDHLHKVRLRLDLKTTKTKLRHKKNCFKADPRDHNLTMEPSIPLIGGNQENKYWTPLNKEIILNNGPNHRLLIAKIGLVCQYLHHSNLRGTLREIDSKAPILQWCLKMYCLENREFPESAKNKMRISCFQIMSRRISKILLKAT